MASSQIPMNATELRPSGGGDGGSSWDHWFQIAKKKAGFDRGMARLKEEIAKLRQAAPDLEPHVRVVAARPNEIIRMVARGRLASEGLPIAGYFRVEFVHTFPQHWPMFFIDVPPAGSGYRLRNLPYVDEQGSCFLTHVSNWNPPMFSATLCLDELRRCAAQDTPVVPLESTPAAAVQPVAPPAQQQQQQQAYQPVTPQAAPATIPVAPMQAVPPTASFTDLYSVTTAALFERAEKAGPGERQPLLASVVNEAEHHRWLFDVWFDLVKRSRSLGARGVVLPSNKVVGHAPGEDPRRSSLVSTLIGAVTTTVPAAEERMTHEAVSLASQDGEWLAKRDRTLQLLREVYPVDATTAAPSAPPSQSVHQQQQLPSGRRLTMETVWKAFFSRAFSVGEAALGNGVLPPVDIVAEEPYLYLGLTALAALEFVLRSPPNGPMKFALGEIDVTMENCPTEGAGVLRAFLEARDALHASRPSQLELLDLRKAVLLAGSHRLAPSLRPELARVVSTLQGIAVDASQQPTFHRHFTAVLQLLADVARAQ